MASVLTATHGAIGRDEPLRLGELSALNPFVQTQKRCPAKGFAPFPYLTPCSGGQGCPGQLLGMPLGIIRDNAVGVGAMVCSHPSCNPEQETIGEVQRVEVQVIRLIHWRFQ